MDSSTARCQLYNDFHLTADWPQPALIVASNQAERRPGGRLNDLCGAYGWTSKRLRVDHGQRRGSCDGRCIRSNRLVSKHFSVLVIYPCYRRPMDVPRDAIYFEQLARVARVKAEDQRAIGKIGRASCRERVCQYV